MMKALKIDKSKSGMMMEMSMPTFSLTQSQLPEIKDWSVGKKYILQIEVEMIGSNKEQYSEKKELSGRFKITKVGAEETEDPAKKGYT